MPENLQALLQPRLLDAALPDGLHEEPLPVLLAEVEGAVVALHELHADVVMVEKIRAWPGQIQKRQGGYDRKDGAGQAFIFEELD